MRSHAFVWARAVWPLVAVLFAAGPALADLDFALQRKALVADAIQVNGTYITDGSSKIFLRIPPTWKVADSSEAIECVPSGATSLVRLERFHGTKPLTIDEAGGRELLRQASTQLPPEARGATALPVELNSLPIFGWQTLEVTLRYEYAGQPMLRSVLYAGMLPGRLVQLTVIAPEADFDKIHKQARQMLGSWFEPSRDLPPDLQRKYEAAKTGGG